MRFLHSVTSPERLITADGIQQFDLAVNPLSVVLLCLRPLNETSATLDFASYLDICGSLSSVTVAHNGSNIVRMSGRDAAAYAFFRHGIAPMEANGGDINNERRCVVLPIFLGKNAYDAKSCFPASTRGELTLELDIDIADTGYDGMRLSIESVEILGAKPKEYERTVTQTQTFAATGDNDIDLPPGNPYRGVLLFGSTGFAGAAPAPTLGRLSTRLDNMEVLYASTDFEVAHMLTTLWGRQPPRIDNHFHRVNAIAVSSTEPSTGPIAIGSGGYSNYSFLDFDPSKDDTFTLATKGSSRFHVRSNAEAAELIRAIGVEVVKV